MEDQKESPVAPGLSPQQQFYGLFQNEITALQGRVARLADNSLVGIERTDAADQTLGSIARLSAEVKDASGYLPAYDQRIYAEAIKALQEKLEETRKAFAPKPKFSFKSRAKSPSVQSLGGVANLAVEIGRKASDHSLSAAEVSSSTTPGSLETLEEQNGAEQKKTQEAEPVATADEQSQTSKPSKQSFVVPSQGNPVEAASSRFKSETGFSLSDQSDTYILLPSPARNNWTPCSLRNITDCVIDLSIQPSATVPFASLTITSTMSSLLLCGLILGPAHITGVKKSILVIKCRQFRMHDCEDVDVYLHCTSRPIIENCKGIRFAPMSQVHDDLTASHQQTTNSLAINMWDQIDDFKWLKAEPSPHWSILPAESRVPDETWHKTVSGSCRRFHDDMLKAVGLEATRLGR